MLLLALGALAACRSTVSADRGDERLESLLAQMSLQEKISLLHGAPDPPASSEGEAGYLPGIARLGVPPLRFADGPPGVLTRHPATALTATMGLAATFSREDARANGAVIARDARAAGIDIVLEPFINMYRDPGFVRGYNTFGEDPLLTAQIAAGEIEGIQAGGVMAQAKHFIAYEGANDVSIDPQTLHEIYLAPFAAAVTAGVASIMCSYNVINGGYACGNPATLDAILRGELRFRGFVTSDWGATHSSLAINAGLDLEMPGSGSVIASYFAGTPAEIDRPDAVITPPTINNIPEETIPAPMPPPHLAGALPIGLAAARKDGSVSERTITRAARRLLVQMQRFGRLDHRAAIVDESPEAIEANAAVVRRTALDAAVLLKNDGAALPLDPQDLAEVALIGPGALQDVATGISGEKALGRIERQIGPSAALREVAGGAPAVLEAVADDMTGQPIPAAQFDGGLQRLDLAGQPLRRDAALDFTLAGADALPAGTSARWSGVLQIPVTGRYRICLQMLGAQGSLSLDGRGIAATSVPILHGDILQPGQDNVLPTRDGLDNVRRELQLQQGPHTLSVQIRGESAGRPVQVRLAWITPQQRAEDYQQAVRTARAARKAVVFVWSRGQPVFHLPGDQDRLIADIAAVNPNTVVVMNVSDPVAMPWLDRVRAVLLLWYPGDEGGRAAADLLLGRVSPGGRLPFTWPRRLEDGPANDPAHPERSSRGIDGATAYSEGIFVGYRWFDQQRIEPLFPFGFGLSYARFEYADLSLARATDGGLDASFRLTNAGALPADEVPQLYLGPPQPAPPGASFAPRALAAFERVHLDAGASRRVSLHAGPRTLQYWSVAQRRWLTAPGGRALFIGASSREPRLEARTPP